MSRTRAHACYLGSAYFQETFFSKLCNRAVVAVPTFLWQKAQFTLDNGLKPWQMQIRLVCEGKMSLHGLQIPSCNVLKELPLKDLPDVIHPKGFQPFFVEACVLKKPAQD